VLGGLEWLEYIYCIGGPAVGEPVVSCGANLLGRKESVGRCADGCAGYPCE
jgi:hypothetical protein